MDGQNNQYNEDDNWATELIQQIADNAVINNPVEPKEEDYYNEEGLLVCGKCHQQKQMIFKMFDRETVVPCVCACEQKTLDEEKRQMEEEDRNRKIQTLREESLMEGRLKEASFENFIRRPGNETALKVAKNFVEQFDAMYEMGQGIIFYGPVGTGKTFTAACIANALLEKQRSVIMTSFVRILQSVSNYRSSESQLMGILKSASLVIIDDFGAERNTEYSSEKVYNVIDSRLNTGRPMILTTNLSMNDLKNPANLTDQRTFDRILESSYPVEMTGKSLRASQAKLKMETVKNILEK